MKSWPTGKHFDAGRDWGQEEKGTTEDEIAGWHHRLNGLESEWTPGVGDGQGGLECCDSWGRKELDTTEWLNWTELNIVLFKLMILDVKKVIQTVSFDSIFMQAKVQLCLPPLPQRLLLKIAYSHLFTVYLLFEFIGPTVFRSFHFLLSINPFLTLLFYLSSLDSFK